MSQFVSYAGKRVVVTGAASGMGAATARLVADLGGEVVTMDIREPDIEGIEHVEVDLSDKASIERAVAALGSAPVHALFNCAGLPNTFPGQQVMAVNFVGHRHLTEGIVPLMPEGSAIAFVASVAGMNYTAHVRELKKLMRTPDHAEALAWCQAHDELVAEGYAFSKEAIVFYTMWRSVELLKQGIRLNCISPGPTSTAMMAAFEDANTKSFMDDFPKPIGRNSTAEEQANVLVFLNSDAASYIAGHNLQSDGGFLAAATTGQMDYSKIMPPAE